MEPLEVAKSDDYLSSCPEEIKFEIIKHFDDIAELCRLSRTSKYWNQKLSSEKIWKPLVIRDFLWWNPSHVPKLASGETWKQKYAEFHTKGWQWDPANCNSNINISEDCTTASLLTGYTYNGVRCNRAENSGRHYFEVQINPSTSDKRFNKGASSTILMGIGVATSIFNVHNCSEGWTSGNNGIGYYSDGQIYALGSFFSSKRYGKTPFCAGDRVAMDFDLDSGTITFLINDSPVTEPIPGLTRDEPHFPYLILAADVKNQVIITRGKGKRDLKAPATNPIVILPKYKSQIDELKSMGFDDEEYCIDLLNQYNGSVEQVVNQLLNQQED